MTNTVELPVFKFTIKGKMAIQKNFPTAFEAVIVRETEKAIYVRGHGLLDVQSGICARCGRTLTHPGSIILGIGPECLGNWGLRKDILTNLNPDEIKKMTTHVESLVVEGWLPKYSVNTIEKTGASLSSAPLAGKPTTPSKAEIIGTVSIKLTFTPENGLLEKVKSLPSRKYHNENGERYWTAPIYPDTLRSIKAWGFELDEALSTILASAPEAKTVEEVEEVPVTGLKMKLMPFQEQGVSFLAHRNGNAIIADEMGLGKTVQALGYLHLVSKRPAVIVVPASLKGNWEVEALKWLPNPKITILSGKKAQTLPDGQDIVIINYDILDAWVDVLKAIRPQVVILDECHYIKNNGAARTKAVKLLCRGVPHTIPLSGTPAINRPVELYNAIKLVEPQLFPNFMTFARRYCNAHHNGFGWDFSGAANLEELYEKLSTVMVRRKKADVLKELPDKIRSFVPMSLSNANEYRAAESEFLSWVLDTKGEKAVLKARRAEQLTKINTLRQLAVNGALKNSIAWIKDFLDGGDQKLVVMAIHKTVIDALMEEFKAVAVKIDGSTPVAQRQGIVDKFQSDPTTRLFIGNIKAAGVGITLTAASNVAFLELPWTPGELDQAEDRVHRIGQKNAVNIWYLLAQNTIEEKLAKMIDSKRGVLTATLDGTEMEGGDTLTALMDLYAA